MILITHETTTKAPAEVFDDLSTRNTSLLSMSSSQSVGREQGVVFGVEEELADEANAQEDTNHIEGKVREKEIFMAKAAV